MFKRKDIATEVNKLIVGYTQQLSNSLKVVEAECSPDEFAAYKSAVGKLMGYAFTEIAGPIYERYPDLMSDNLKAAAQEYSRRKAK